MAYENIEFEIVDGVAVIRLNRPDRLNAFNDGLLVDLKSAFDTVESDDAIRAVLITGNGRGFCAGADLAAGISQGDDGKADAGKVLEEFYNPMILRMRAMKQPIVAAVNGPAAGAGMSLALACDIVFAAKSASFLQAFARIALVPDAGSTWLLPRLVGHARALALTLLAEPLPAEEAKEWGMIYKVVEDEALMDEALGLAKKLAAGPTGALGEIKNAINASWGNSLSEQLDLERDRQRVRGGTGDFTEGVKAFLEKRPAQFAGD